ncbi:MAG TPA: hypothetical protein DCP02_05645 [Actinobacteria bacterium]|nr:hypothetical protein [Actinomycetota bacterium]
MSEKVNITIIGAGVIGCAIAHCLSRNIGSSKDIVVIEKNEQINGENQSSRNSGVIHAGVYYPNNIGPLKAKLCVKGNKMLYDFCAEYKIPHKKCGKLIVATDSLEEQYLEDVYEIAKRNRVPGLRLIDKKEIKKMEANVYGTAALYVPTSGIIEATSLVNKLYRLSEEAGAIFLAGNKVTSIKPVDGLFEVNIQSETDSEVFLTEMVINCAGLYSDDIARMINPESPYRMDPIKGESAMFYRSSSSDIEMNGLNVYPVPFGYLPDGSKLRVDFDEFKRLFKEGKVHKSVGVHLTPTFDTRDGKFVIGDTVTMGPAYSVPKDRDDYSSARDTGYYCSMVKPFFPNIKLEDISLHQAGIRAKLSRYYDFVIERDAIYNNLINLIGIDSPGLTASLAIAEYTLKMIH